MIKQPLEGTSDPTIVDPVLPTPNVERPNMVPVGYDSPAPDLYAPFPHVSGPEQIMYNLAAQPYTGTWSETLFGEKMGLTAQPGDDILLSPDEANKKYPTAGSFYKEPTKQGHARRNYENEQRMQSLSEVLAYESGPVAAVNFLTNIAAGIVLDPAQTLAISAASLGTGVVLGKTLGAIGTTMAKTSMKSMQTFGSVMAKSGKFFAGAATAEEAAAMSLSSKMTREAALNVITDIAATPLMVMHGEYRGQEFTEDMFADQILMDVAFGSLLTGAGHYYKKLKGNRASGIAKQAAEQEVAAHLNGKKSLAEFAEQEGHEPVYETPGDGLKPAERTSVDISEVRTVEQSLADDHAIFKMYDLDKVADAQGPFIKTLGHESYSPAPKTWYAGMEVHGGDWENIHTYGPSNSFGQGVLLSTDKMVLQEIGSSNNAPNNHVGTITMHPDALLLDIDRSMEPKIYGKFVEFMQKEFGFESNTIRKVFGEHLPMKKILEELAEHVDEINPIDKFNKILAKELGIAGYKWDTTIQRKSVVGEVQPEIVQTSQVFNPKYIAVDHLENVPHNPNRDYFGKDIRNRYKEYLKTRESDLSHNPEMQKYLEAKAEQLEAEAIYKETADEHTKRITDSIEALEAQERFADENIEFVTDAEKLRKEEFSEAVKKGKQRAAQSKKIFEDMEACMFGRGE